MYPKTMLACAIAAIVVPAFAQEATPVTTLSTVTVTVTADRLSLPRDQAASPVRLLGRADLDALPVKDVTEALATLPNVNIRRSGGVEAEPSLGMYGISAQPRSSSSTTLAINGVALNNGMFPEASLNMLPLSMLDHLEVIQGPASSAYGNNARLGVVNLVTRQKQTFGGEVAASAAKWNTTSVGGYVGGALSDGGHYLLGFDKRGSDGSLQPKGVADFNDATLNNLAFFADKAFGNVIIKGGFLRYAWDRHDPSYLVQPGTPAARNPIGTPTSRAENGQRQHLNVGAEWLVSDQWRAALTYSSNSLDEQTSWNANYGTASGFGSTAPVSQRTDSDALLAKLEWETANNLLTLGLERQNGKLLDRVTRVETSGSTTGYFLQDRYLAFNRQLSLLAGYRVDKFSFYDETSNSPKVGFVWKPTGGIWLLRGNVSKAFSAPSFNQLFGSFGNTKLVATTFGLKEVGLEVSPSKTLALGVTAFDTASENPIYPRPRNQNPICTPGAGNCFVNVAGTTYTHGVTLDLRHHISSNWQWGGSHTWLNPEENTFATAGSVLKLDTSYRAGSWRISADLQRETQRHFQDNHLSPFPDFTVINASVGYRFGGGWEVSANVENLTNETYATTQIVSSNSAFPALPINRPERYVTLRANYAF